MKKALHFNYTMFTLVLIGFVFPVTVSAFIYISLPERQLINEPLHAALVTFGAVTAVVMSMILFQRKAYLNGEKSFLLALGFLGMGILEVFHAGSGLAECSISLQRMAGLISGFWFASVWVPEFDRYSVRKKWILWLIAAGFILLGIWITAFPELFPAMIRDDRYTPTAAAISLMSVLFFSAAAAFYMVDFHHSGRKEPYLFALLFLLFGLSELEFPLSKTWCLNWWWHLQRMIASLVVLGFVVREHRLTVSRLITTLDERKRAEEALQNAHGELEEKVRERTAELLKVNETLREEIAEREAVGIKLRKSEARYRLITENSYDLICMIDREGNYVYLSPSYKTILGYAPEELIGVNSFSLLHPDERERLIHTFREHWEKKEGGIEEIRYRHRNGEWRIFELRGDPVLDDAGNPQYAVFVSRDITERRQAEGALRESERRFHDMLENVNLVAVMLDRNGDIIFCNNFLLELTGWEREAVMGRNWFDIFIPDDHVRKMFFETLENGTMPPHYENPIITRRGDIRYVSWNNSILRDTDNRIIGTASIGVDLTEQKRAEEFAENILETVDEGFIVIDHDYRIVSANRAYCRQVCKSVEDIVGRHCYEVSHHLYRPCSELGEDCAVRRTFNTGKSHTTVHMHYDSEGGIIHVETKCFPMKDASGDVIGAIEIVNNITERKKLENQLHHAQKMEAIGQLAGGIAHDFNNILTAIIGYGNLLRIKMEGDDQAKLYVDQILMSADRAAHLTQGLLTFSRKQVINPRPMNLNETIKRVEKLLSRLIGEDIELKTKLSVEELTVMADYGQIDQVLMNLVTNARDAMPDGGFLLIESERMKLDEAFIKIHNYGEPGDYAWVSITDTGGGMDETTKGKIFEPFFTTKEMGKGTGLGLAIVYGIIKQNRGYINVYSEPGKGTTFKIYLPLITSEAEKALPVEPEHFQRGTETVLLAEDDAQVRDLTKTVLEKFGYTVIEAVDGEDAVRKFADNREKIQLIMLDVIMPKRNGKEAYEEILKARPDVKALFTSGYTAEVVHRKTIVDEGMNFISKPISPTELLKKVREILD